MEPPAAPAAPAAAAPSAAAAAAQPNRHHARDGCHSMYVYVYILSINWYVNSYPHEGRRVRAVGN